MWQEGNQAQGKPAQNKEHGERQIDFSCDNVQRSDDHQQKADQLDLGHIETKEDFPRVGKKCTLGVSYREEDVRRGKTLRERAARAPARLALVKLLPALDVEMTHPPALDAESMTHGPAWQASSQDLRSAPGICQAALSRRPLP
jgi:hypothetical protein